MSACGDMLGWRDLWSSLKNIHRVADRVVALEEWMMHTDRLLASLNEVVCALQDRLDEQNRKLETLSAALESPGVSRGATQFRRRTSTALLNRYVVLSLGLDVDDCLGRRPASDRRHRPGHPRGQRRFECHRKRRGHATVTVHRHAEEIHLPVQGHLQADERTRIDVGRLTPLVRYVERVGQQADVTARRDTAAVGR